MFGSLQQSVCASFADRFVESGDGPHFRPLGKRKAYRVSVTEAIAITENFVALVERVDQLRGRLMKAIIPAVLLWAFVCIALRKLLGSDPWIDSFYMILAFVLMIGLPVLAYGQFWLAVFGYLLSIGRRLSDRPSIDAPILQTYRARNPFQFALRWTALLALCAFMLIGFVLPETHPELAREMKPWIEFDVGQLLFALGLLYCLSMLWNWIAARRAGRLPSSSGIS